jgi:hypothetical protein
MKRVLMFPLVLSALWLAGPVTAQQPPDTLHWQYRTEAVANQPDQVDVVFEAKIGEGWILYASDFQPIEFGPRPARVALAHGGTVLGEPQAVGSRSATQRNFAGEYTYTYFSGTAQLRQRVKVDSATGEVRGTLNAQTCFEASGVCNLVREPFTVTVPTR